MRIAIVGTGISGLTCAHLLHEQHELTLFEAGPYIGGHTNTVDVRRNGHAWPVDTGFIVFNDWTYPHFIRLLERLGVPSRPTTMSFSVKCEATGLEYNGTSLNSLFAQRSNLFRPSFWGMIRDILRFNREAPALLGTPAADLPLTEYLDSAGYGRAFVEQYLIPMGAAIWSMPPDRLREFPVGFFVRFFHNHGMLSVNDRPQWRTVEGGSRAYVDRLIEPIADRVRTNARVHEIRRDHAGVTLDGERFDEVILATHSDTALSLLSDATDAEHEILGALPYQENETVLHTDASVLPRRRLAWAAWNYHLGRDDTQPVGVTYNMNMLQGLDAPETFCVSLNQNGAVDPERVIRRIRYHHPVYSREGVLAQQRHAEISGVNHTHFCGAYWGYGFHEDGVKSGLAVANAFGAEL